MPFQAGLQLEVAEVKYPFQLALHKPKVGAGREQESQKAPSMHLPALEPLQNISFPAFSVHEQNAQYLPVCALSCF